MCFAVIGLETIYTHIGYAKNIHIQHVTWSLNFSLPPPLGRLVRLANSMYLGRFGMPPLINKAGYATVPRSCNVIANTMENRIIFKFYNKLCSVSYKKCLFTRNF